MPQPRPYDRRIPDRNPLGRRCRDRAAAFATVVTVVACGFSGCSVEHPISRPAPPVMAATTVAVPVPAVTR